MTSPKVSPTGPCNAHALAAAAEARRHLAVELQAAELKRPALVLLAEDGERAATEW